MSCNSTGSTPTFLETISQIVQVFRTADKVVSEFLNRPDIKETVALVSETVALVKEAQGKFEAWRDQIQEYVSTLPRADLCEVIDAIRGNHLATVRMREVPRMQFSEEQLAAIFAHRQRPSTSYHLVFMGGRQIGVLELNGPQ